MLVTPWLIFLGVFVTPYPREYLERTINLFQPFSETPLTIEDAREIADCALDVYEYVLGLKQKEKTNGKEEKTRI